MLNLIIFFASSISILLSYIIFSLTKFDSKTDAVIAGFTLSVFQVIIIELFLGTIGLLIPLYVVLVNILFAIFIFTFSINKLNKKNFKFFIPFSLKNTKTIFILQIIIASYCLIVFLGFIIPPYAWDSITYHLFKVFTWIKAQQLILPQPIRDTSFFPINGELLMLWMLLAGKNLYLLNIVQIPFAFMLALSTYGLAKKLKISYAEKLIPLVLLTPVVMLQCTVAYVDVIFSCLVIISLNFLIGYIQSKKEAFLFLCCIALGLVSGVKPAGFLSIPILVFLMFFAKKNKSNIRHLILAVTLFLSAGGIFYIINLVFTGNPVFPYTIKILNINIFKGITELSGQSPYEQWFVTNRWEWLLYPVFEKVRGEFTYSIENGFGIQFVLGFLSLIYAMYISFIKKHKTIFLVFLLFPITIFFWLKTNTCPVPRYIIFICSIAAIAIIYVYNHMTSLQRKFLDFLILYCLFFSFISTLPKLIPHQANVLNAYFKNGKLSAYDYYHWVYGELAKSWEWLDKNVPPGSIIAYNHHELVTPLYGGNIQNNIIHIPTYNTPYKGNKTAANYAQWKKMLSKHHVSYFFAYVPYWNPKAVHSDYKWAKKHPEDFIELKSWGFDSTHPIVIYKINFTN